MVTYDVTGIRLLNTGEYVGSWALAGAQSNVRLTTPAAAATQTINSLTLASGGGLTIGSGATLTIDSGDVLALALALLALARRRIFH
jgi:hypothetical protein